MRTVNVFITINDTCISLSSGPNKATISEAESKRLVYEFIEFQKTIPITQYIHVIVKKQDNEVKLPQGISQYVDRLGSACCDIINKY